MTTNKGPLDDHMTAMVSMDMDLPAIPRWQMHALQFPHVAVFLAEKYGTKEDVQFYKERMKNDQH